MLPAVGAAAISDVGDQEKNSVMDTREKSEMKAVSSSFGVHIEFIDPVSGQSDLGGGEDEMF